MIILNYIFTFKDINLRELAILLPLTFLVGLLGIFPDLIFDLILVSTSLNIEYYNY